MCPKLDHPRGNIVVGSPFLATPDIVYIYTSNSWIDTYTRMLYSHIDENKHTHEHSKYIEILYSTYLFVSCADLDSLARQRVQSPCFLRMFFRARGGQLYCDRVWFLSGKHISSFHLLEVGGNVCIETGILLHYDRSPFTIRRELNPRHGTEGHSYDDSFIPLGYRSTYQIWSVLW